MMRDVIKPVILAVMASLLPALSNAAPITFNTALPVSEGQLIYRGVLSFSRSSESLSNDPANLDRELDVVTATSVFAYGVNPNLAVFGVLPFSDRELDIDDGSGRVTRNNQGVGDLTGFARYQLWQKDGRGSTLRLAGIGGVTAPTGNHDDSDGLGQLPPSLQTGSGAWDWFSGVVATYQTLKTQFNGQVSYRDNREANGVELGDAVNIDLSWQQRLWQQDVARGVPGFFYGVLELNFLHQDKNRFNGRSNNNSGGDTVWLSPGVQYVTRRWVLEAVVQAPLIQDLNGSALENDFIVITSFRRSF